MKFKHLPLLLFGLFTLQAVTTQEKNEREYRITKSDFPEKAAQSLEPIDSRSVKYLKETDNEKVSYEAKFKYNKQYFSVEFDQNGILEDIEILIKKRQFKARETDVVTDYFRSNYVKFKLLKIQLQYLNKSETEDYRFIDDVLNGRMDIKPNYEIVVKVKTAKETVLKEFVFGPEGKLLSERRIKTSDYDHVLY